MKTFTSFHFYHYDIKISVYLAPYISSFLTRPCCKMRSHHMSYSCSTFYIIDEGVGCKIRWNIGASPVLCLQKHFNEHVRMHVVALLTNISSSVLFMSMLSPQCRAQWVPKLETAPKPETIQ